LLKPSGIAVLSTQGKVAILTDYDVSGIMIAQQVPEVPRIGIDGDLTLNELDILDNKADLEEIYIPGKTHLKAVEDNIDEFEELIDLEYLRKKRIEIDVILREVGAVRFAYWIMAKLEEIFSGEELDYNRSVKIPEPYQFVPDELESIKELVIGRIRTVLQPEIDSTSNKLAHYIPDNEEDGLINNVEEYEYSLFDEFQEVVDDHADPAPIVKDLRKLLKKHQPKESS
jgi:hypothetical protein